MRSRTWWTLHHTLQRGPLQQRWIATTSTVHKQPHVWRSTGACSKAACSPAAPDPAQGLRLQRGAAGRRPRARACGSIGVACGEDVLVSGACTWNTVWWKSVYALERAPVPSSCSRRKLPRNVTCSTRCASPCWSGRSSTLPARSGGTILRMFLRVLWQYLAVSAQRAEAAAACHLSAGGGAGWRRRRPAHNRERRGECASPVQHVGGRLHGGHGPGRRAPRGARTGVDLQVRLEALGRHRVGQDDVVQAIVQPPGHELAVGLQRRVQQRPHLCQALALVYLRRPLAPLNHRQMNTPRQAAKRPCQLQQVPQRVRRISACLLPPPVTCAARQPPQASTALPSKMGLLVLLQPAARAPLPTYRQPLRCPPHPPSKAPTEVQATAASLAAAARAAGLRTHQAPCLPAGRHCLSCKVTLPPPSGSSCRRAGSRLSGHSACCQPHPPPAKPREPDCSACSALRQTLSGERGALLDTALTVAPTLE